MTKKTKTAIAVSNLSRRFPVYKGGKPVTGETFLALDNISFDIPAGQSVGILGGNGAGKSTLLKILARIIPPTSGRAELHGRVGTLLEAGAGFHPELTGRDNIFLAGALLGMKEHEIRRQFDAIVEFAAIGDFLEAPVKRYSSGMFMRLAFSVAAHIEPEILLVDEVLAVGDAQFQKRCLERLQSLGEHGQTILFVSHSMPAVARLCRHALWLDHGKLRMAGPVAEVSTAYMKQEAASPGERVWPRDSSAPGNEMARLYRLRVAGPDGATVASINIGQPFAIEMEFEVLTGGHVLFPVLRIVNEWGADVVWTTDVTAEHHGRPRPAGLYRCVVRFPANLMSEGLMSVTALLRSPLHGVPVFREMEAVHFQATEIIDGTTSRGAYPSDIPAAVRPKLDWEVELS